MRIMIIGALLLAATSALAEPLAVVTKFQDCKGLAGTLKTGERAICAKCVGRDGAHQYDPGRAASERCQTIAKKK